jgi:iron complex transport system substrate-binding protein
MGVAVGLAALALAGFGGGGAAEADGGTRSFVDVRGEPIEVPDDPQRIVAIHDSNGGVQVLELGERLVGLATRDGGFELGVPEGAIELGDPEPVGQVYEPNVEAIAALDPDLIVGEGYAGKGMDNFMADGVEARLAQIAPTVYIDVFRPIDEVMADFAELLGDEATARYEELKAEYDVGIAGLKEELADREGLSGVFVQHGVDGFTIWGRTAVPSNNIFEELGVAQPPIVDEADEGDRGGYFGNISLERIPEVSADVILLDAAQDNEYSGDHRNSPLWQRLPAVGADQIVRTDETWNGTTYSVYLHALEAMGPALLDADPDVFQAPWEREAPAAE